MWINSNTWALIHDSATPARRKKVLACLLAAKTAVIVPIQVTT